MVLDLVNHVFGVGLGAVDLCLAVISVIFLAIPIFAVGKAEFDAGFRGIAKYPHIDAHAVCFARVFRGEIFGQGPMRGYAAGRAKLDAHRWFRIIRAFIRGSLAIDMDVFGIIISPHTARFAAKATIAFIHKFGLRRDADAHGSAMAVGVVGWRGVWHGA